MIRTASWLRISVAVSVLVTSLSGCARDYSMAPLPGGEKVTISLKISEELEPDIMSVMYRSNICQRTTFDGDGRPEALDGYNGYEMKFSRQGQSGDYKAELFVDGGGPCGWRLSNVVFGVAYSVPNRLGENVVAGTGCTVVVVFDHNNAQLQVSDFKVVTGPELKIVEDYYPWINESFIGGYIKRASSSGERRGILMYETRQARSIYFEPVLHSDYVVTSVAPKKHAIGEFLRFSYPDGTLESDGQPVPNFRKIQQIRMMAEAKK